MSPSAEESPETAESKKALRRELRARARSLEAGSGTDPERGPAERIADRVLALPEIAEARSVLTCLSFGDELDTWGLAERLLEAGKQVYVPRADPRDRRLHVHRYPCELETLSFGLRQPPRGAPEVPEERVEEAIDAVLVLGLGFDRRGIRLGHGGGYFDRFLGVHPDLLAIGLAAEVQIVERLPREPHDVPMDLVVTDERVLRPAGPG